MSYFILKGHLKEFPQMIVAAMLMMLAAETQAQSDCAASAPRGPDFMAMMSGDDKDGSTIQDQLGGTITHPPVAQKDIAPGTMAMNKVFSPFPVDRPKADETKEEAEQRARNEAAGICNAGKRPA